MKIINKPVTFLVLGLSCSVIMILFYAFELCFRFDMLERLELKTLDYRFLVRGVEEPDDRIVIVGIDKKSLDNIKDPIIFWRPYFAQVIRKISESGAKTIGLDFVFPIPLTKKVDGLDHDMILAKALGEADNVLLTKTFKYKKEEDCYVFEEPIRQLRFAASPNYTGFVNFTSDSDNTVRRQTLLVKDCKGDVHIAFGLAVLLKYLDKLERENIRVEKNKLVLGGKDIPINRYGEMLINFAGPSGTFHHISFYDVLKKTEGNSSEYFKDLFANKIVLIGSTNFLHQDFKPTPFFMSNNYSQLRSTYGVKIWANVIDTMLQEKYISRLICWQVALIILFIGLLVGYISFRFSLIESLICSILVGVVYIFLCVFLFVNNGLWIDIISPTLTIPLTCAAVFSYKYYFENKQRTAIKKLFEYYLHPSVVDELIKNPKDVKLGGTKKEVTIFFSDIVGFTTIAESIPPEELIKFMNRYFNEISKIILKYKGTIDQYAGDAIMAFYGAPMHCEEHAELACYAAIESQRHLNYLQESLSNEGFPPMHIRIGVNTGNVIVGNVGGENRFHYTVLGDDVNLTSRLEGANKIYGTNIMISEHTYKFVKHSVVTRELDIIRVKGMVTPIKVYELIAKKDEVDQKYLELLEHFKDGLSAYKEMDWQEAIDSFVLALKIDKKDGPTQLYLKRCADYLKSPPRDDWDGVFTIQSK